MRNGDFLPTRLQAQQDAVNLVCHSKTRSNPENNVGLLTLAKYDYTINCRLCILIYKLNTFKLKCNDIFLNLTEKTISKSYFGSEI